MSFLRPEIVAAARRWREAFAGCGMCLLALWAWVAGLGIVPWLAFPLGVVGGALVWIGMQRARFRQRGDGPGLVQVIEGQIVYFAPISGGTVALGSLTALVLNGTVWPAQWLLTDDAGGTLAIPVTASGSETLFDAFAQLEGLRTEALLRALENGDRTVSVLWRRGAPRQPIAYG